MASKINVDKIARGSGTPEFTIPTADGTNGQAVVTDGSGVLSFADAGPSLTGSTNNTIVTVTGANAMQGETNLTYDGNVLDIKNAGTASSINLYCESSNAHYTKIKSGPHSGATAYTLTLPNKPPTANGQALTATTAGVGSWSGNSPSFQARNTTAQGSLSSDAYTKIQYNTEDWDPDSVYDHSTNYRFTVPAGGAGKYQLYSQVYIMSTGQGNMQQTKMYFYLNGSASNYGNINDMRSGREFTKNVWCSAIMNLSVGDYIEVYCTINTAAGTWEIDNNRGYFSGYKLIGV